MINPVHSPNVLTSDEGWVVPERITPAWVALAVEQLYEMSDSYDAFYTYEQRLYMLVLEAIATRSCDNPALCAHIALEGQTIERPRPRGQ